MTTNLSSIVEQFSNLRVLVIGEAILDSYWYGQADRLCPEAPVPVVNLHHRQNAAGGAANTAINLHTLGADVLFLSVVGEDSEGAMLRQTLVQRGVSTASVLSQPGRRTLTKSRVLANQQILLRLDQGCTEAIDPEMEQALMEQLQAYFCLCDAVVVSDYGYGILTPRILQTLAELQAQTPGILVVDSKQLPAYRPLAVTAIKPNYKEAIQLLGLSEVMERDARIDQIILHQEALFAATAAQMIAVTLDRDGAIVLAPGQSPHLTTVPPIDHPHPVGAGDTFMSALTLALAAGADRTLAADLATIAAGIVVAQPGTTACSQRELLQTAVGGKQTAEGRN